MKIECSAEIRIGPDHVLSSRIRPLEEDFLFVHQVSFDIILLEAETLAGLNGDLSDPLDLCLKPLDRQYLVLLPRLGAGILHVHEEILDEVREHALLVQELDVFFPEVLNLVAQNLEDARLLVFDSGNACLGAVATLRF